MGLKVETDSHYEWIKLSDAKAGSVVVFHEDDGFDSCNVAIVGDERGLIFLDSDGCEWDVSATKQHKDCKVRILPPGTKLIVT